MKITHLGHQGWLFEASSGDQILLDPIFKTMGNGLTRLPVWPNRELCLDKLGHIPSVIISHEHADHFNIETLLKLRMINNTRTAYVPKISARSLKNALKAMEYNVVEMEAFNSFFIGSMEITPLPSLKSRLEPDVFSLLVRDTISKSSFFTPIDTVPSPLAIAYLEQHCPVRTIDNFTNNFVQRIPKLHKIPFLETLNNQSHALTQFYEFLKTFGSKTVLISGQGWCYDNHLSVHNKLMFVVDHNDLINSAKETHPNLNVTAACAGDAFDLNLSQLIKSTAPVVKFGIPSDRSRDASLLHSYELSPYCAIADTAEINSYVHDFVVNKLGSIVSLGASRLGKALYYQEAHPEDEMKGLFLELKTENKSYQYEFSYFDSAFYLIEKNYDLNAARSFYAFGMSGFVKDFYQILIGAEEGHLVSENAMITWNNRDDLLPEPVDVDFMHCLRPQFHPTVYENHYQNEILRLSSL